MSSKVLDFQKARAAKLAEPTADMAEMLAELSQLAAAGGVKNLFIGLTTAAGEVHYGWVPGDVTALADDQALNMLGMLRIAERGFIDAFEFEPVPAPKRP